MKIEVGKYTLYSDQWSMWITEKYETKDKKTKLPSGKYEERRVAGYSTSFKNLLSSFQKTKVWGSDAESLEELLEVLKATYEDMESIYKCAVEHDFKMIERMRK